MESFRISQEKPQYHECLRITQHKPQYHGKPPIFTAETSIS